MWRAAAVTRLEPPGGWRWYETALVFGSSWTTARVNVSPWQERNHAGWPDRQEQATQRLMARYPGGHQVANYDDLRLVSLLTTDDVATDEFLADTLGELGSADRDTVDTVRTWIAEQCNTSRTAARLYTHRNTVIRRIARADTLLPRPLAENLVDVAAALEILRWRPVEHR